MAGWVVSCGRAVCAVAGVVLAFPALVSAASTGPLGLVITDGPSDTVATRTATFMFTANAKATSFACTLDGGEPTPCNDKTITYTGLADGSHAFLVTAAAGGRDADKASRSWIVAVPPETHIDSGPAPTVRETTAVFTFSSVPNATSFECSLDGGDFATCASPKTYSDLARTRHQFDVRAVTEVGSDPTPATSVWEVLAPSPLPDTRIVTAPTQTTHRATATLVFASIPAGAGFECSLDGRAFAPCPATYTTVPLGRGRHTLAVRSVSAAGRDPTPVVATWTFVPRLRAPDTIIVRAPSGDTEERTALVSFRSPDRTARFECALDGDSFAFCQSPIQLSRLDGGDHRLLVRARTAAGVDRTPAVAAWSVVADEAGVGGWKLPAGIGAALVVAAGAITLAARLRLRARRLEWQLEASEEEPHGPCEGGRRIQKELTLKPARRTIAHLDVEGRDSRDRTLRRRVEGAPVDGLNDAVRSYRRDRRISPELRVALLPVATALFAEIEGWLGAQPVDRQDVLVRAHLEGGKAEWKFTPWRCVRGRWQSGRSWTVEVEDERDAAAAIVAHPYPSHVAAEVLLSQLSAFVAEVDVTRAQRPPERAPVLHG
jgi:hypothetical protein